MVDGKKLPSLLFHLLFSIIGEFRRSHCQTTSGVVSSFLNRDAKVGLAVETHGPFGQFYFDKSLHGKIVLFAGGSGITPIMSMLRYIEEAASETEIILFLMRCPQRAGHHF